MVILGVVRKKFVLVLEGLSVVIAAVAHRDDEVGSRGWIRGGMIQHLSRGVDPGCSVEAKGFLAPHAAEYRQTGVPRLPNLLSFACHGKRLLLPLLVGLRAGRERPVPHSPVRRQPSSSFYLGEVRSCSRPGDQSQQG
jgi:primosomal replication protein N